MPAGTVVRTLLFTDLEGSTRLWEQQPEAMRAAVAAHDAICQEAVQTHHGSVVKMVGDGLYAVFEDPLDGVGAMLTLQHALADPQRTAGLALRARCGLHVGAVEERQGDFFGPPVNRAARIMGVAHGGQMLVSQVAEELLRDRLGVGLTLRRLGQVRLKDLAQPECVFQVVSEGLRGDFPALGALVVAPGNLPVPPTDAIGREIELEALGRELATCRLLTMVGPGGIGKTRLAIQLAANAAGDFPDGTWFIDLSSVSDRHLVPQIIASALSLRPDPVRGLMGTIRAHLENRQLLLVLDNCEHLLEECARVALTLLDAGPGVRVLATSREAMRIRGEVVRQIEPLRSPGGEPRARPWRAVSLTEFPAVQMLVERTVELRSSFVLDDSNASAVARICHELDGIPLALELAAAKLQFLEPEQVALALRNRMRLLVGGDRSAQPRQQTLKALIQWSYDLLNEEERLTFRRLSVLAGSFAPEVAQALIAGPDVTAEDVLPLLLRLAEKSLVARDASAGRFRILESIRSYGLLQLQAHEEVSTWRTRHLQLFMDAARTCDADFRGPGQSRALERLDQDIGNLIAAQEWALASADMESAVGLIESLHVCLNAKGWMELASRMAEAVIDAPAARAPTLLRAKVLFIAGNSSCRLGRFEAAIQWLEEALEISRQQGSDDLTAKVLQPLGICAWNSRQLELAGQCMKQAIGIARRRGSLREVMAGLSMLGQFHRSQQEDEQAAPLFDEGLEIAITLKERSSEAIILLNLAMLAIEGKGHRSPADAQPMLERVQCLIAENGLHFLQGCLHDTRAALCVIAGDRSAALKEFDLGETLVRETGYPRDSADEGFVARWRARV